MQHFLNGLDPDLKQSLLQQLKILWAHHSTGLEGNSLTLGETHAIITEGLTISGKPLAEHNEVMGHVRAEDLMEKLIQSNIEITQQNLFDLHQSVQTNLLTDVYQPIGSWKVEPNSAVVILDNKQIINDSYANPKDVPHLMQQWLTKLNRSRQTLQNETQALENYTWLHAAFVRIHPFADGNGRMARLLANIPLLSSGFPPIVILKENRLQYIRTLAQWQLSLGRVLANQELVTCNDAYQAFEKLCQISWEPSQKLVRDFFEIQKSRNTTS